MSWCAPVSTCKHLWTCLFLVRMPDALPVHPDNQVSTWLCACQPCGAWRSSWAFPTAQIWAQICGRSKHARIVFLIAIKLSFGGNLWQNSFPFHFQNLSLPIDSHRLGPEVPNRTSPRETTITTPAPQVPLEDFHWIGQSPTCPLPRNNHITLITPLPYPDKPKKVPLPRTIRDFHLGQKFQLLQAEASRPLPIKLLSLTWSKKIEYQDLL